jgi:hypothetical protein
LGRFLSLIYSLSKILKENLYKAGGSLRRLKQAESLLWCGQVNEVIDLFKDLKKKAFKTFCNYLETHRCRIVNYLYYLEESLISLVLEQLSQRLKELDERVKLSGSQWNIESVSSILSLRCAYLNCQLSS